ncbi:MAG: TlpA family protein disulfide reductase [Proteobacteria bacterium]|nr:TlpA family protein disulfide reductase [Pseudomonadota bacterium]
MHTKILTLISILLLSFTTIAKKDLPNVGDIAPNFEITQLDGSTYKLSDYKGKQAVYLIFWNTWCTFCMKKTPTLKKMQQNIPDELKIIAVNTTNKDSLEEVLEFKQRFNITYPLAFDTGKIVTDLYNVWGTPTEFIIDINGIIQFRDEVPGILAGYLNDWNTIKSYIPLKNN